METCAINHFPSRSILNKMSVVFPGMFSKRTLLPGEIVCEYRGTTLDLTPQELDTLTDQYVDRGNGLVTLNPGRQSLLVIDPYVVDGQAIADADCYPVWANNAHRGEKGCNIELKRQT